MQNFDKDCFRCLIAYLQSSLYQGLLFFGLVDGLGMHLSLISIREEAKAEIRSVELRIHHIMNEINPSWPC